MSNTYNHTLGTAVFSFTVRLFIRRNISGAGHKREDRVRGFHGRVRLYLLP